MGLYNHGGWFGEPENQIAIIEHLKMSNVGIVYNLHHGHDHVERFKDFAGEDEAALVGAKPEWHGAQRR